MKAKIQFKEKVGFCLITSHKKKVTYIKENVHCSLGPNDGETLVEEVSNVEVLPNGV